MNIIEFLYKNKTHLGYTEQNNPDLIHVLQTADKFCDILRKCCEKNDDIVETLRSFSSKPFVLNAIDEPLIWLVPGVLEELTAVHVFGFGYTHKNRILNNLQPPSPEQFYKGNGSTLFAHNARIVMPKDIQSVGEEAELVAVYFIGKKGEPIFIGYAMGNDLSDPLMRRMDAKQFAASKLRPSAIGAELCLGALPSIFKGCVSIQRNGKTVWSADYNTGTSQLLYNMEVIMRFFVEMAVPLAGNLYYVFLGADKHSFEDNFRIKSEDIVCINSESCVFPLSNQVIML
ncbi:MAG: hypothetical protein K0R48_701 [Gammaproteobacteria bacterium]|jgi:hypothetical protein|nr:hypothetical protein [Gammaproteobacteria bacterium]